MASCYCYLVSIVTAYSITCTHYVFSLSLSPALNLGTPKPSKTHKVSQSSSVSSGQSHDTVTSPVTMATNELYPAVLCNAGAYPVKGLPVHSSSGKVTGQLNSARKGKMEGMTNKQLMATHPHAMAVRQSERNSPSPVNSYLAGGMGLNPSPGGMNINLVKPNLINSEVGSHVGSYPSPPSSHYMHHYGGVAMMGGAKQDIKGMYDSLSKPDGSELN